MIHKAWCSIEEVPYYFSRSYIKFQGHTGWKIDDLDQIWARLLGRSQLSNSSDLPCYTTDHNNHLTRQQFSRWYKQHLTAWWHILFIKYSVPPREIGMLCCFLSCLGVRLWPNITCVRSQSYVCLVRYIACSRGSVFEPADRKSNVRLWTHFAHSLHSLFLCLYMYADRFDRFRHSHITHIYIYIYIYSLLVSLRGLSLV